MKNKNYYFLNFYDGCQNKTVNPFYANLKYINYFWRQRQY